jgi:AcrR family transcriptional regulator
VPRIDHTARREAIAEAAWRIIRRDGLHAVSVRTVAGEVGLSTGSLRHVFASQAELLQFSMELVAERIRARIAAIPDAAPARERIERMVSEILPLDAERVAEAEVWLAFVARSRVEPSLRRLVEQLDEAQRAWLRSALAEMFIEQHVRDRDATREAERLYAVMDGLVLHAIASPGSLSRDLMTDALAQHLDELGADPATHRKL